MIKSVLIDGHFGDQKVELIIEDNVLVITGDNGNGKTTILNIIYSALVGDIRSLYNYSFSSIRLLFDENFSEIESIDIKSYVIDFKRTIVFKYKYHNDGDIITKEIIFKKTKLKQINMYKNNEEIEYSLSESSYQDEVKKTNSNMNIQFVVSENQVIADLCEESKEITLYNKLLKVSRAILYFPTYRRIDMDILEYLKEDLPMGMVRRFEERSTLRSNLTEKDRRVIGISNRDISEVLDNYSKKISQFTSKSLDRLLRDFVKNFLETIMTNQEQEGISISFNNYKESEIFDTLGSINNLLSLGLGENQLLDFSSYYSESVEEVNELSEALTKPNKGKGNNKDLLPLLKVLSNQSGWMNYIKILEDLYKEYQQDSARILESFIYISENISDFTNGKIELHKKNNSEFEILKNKKKILFEQLSTGEKQLFTFFVYTALHTEDTASLIIIDEPELSLHVKWQNELMSSLLKKDNTSFLVATHSPFIISNKRVENHVVELMDGGFYE